jgi:serine/threonine protein kinase
MKGEPTASSPQQPERGRQEAIFEAARALEPGQRAAYLARVCGEDASLRHRLENLLAAADQAGDFLEPSLQPPAPASTMVVSLPVTEKAGDVIGHYKIREKLGEGGCGAVYVAEQTEPVRRRVALKIIKLGMDTRSVIARFEAERQALAMMDHPNIAKVLDAGTTDTGRPFFVMELVRGIRITEYCDQHNLDTTQRLSLFIQVCHAIQHAHQKGIIHRDIKPSNILVTLHDGVPVPKVIDFGIAKAIEGRLSDLTVYTELHQFIGTPAYMSPEQAEMSGLDIDTRSDIYSLGVLLYELLTGRTPFDPRELLEAGLDQMRRTIREKEPLRPSTRLSTMLDADLTSVAKSHGAEPPRLIHFIKGDLDWIVMKALEKDRTRRFETANSLAADVQRFLRNEPVEACPPSNFYRFQKLVRRNKTTFAAGSAVAAALVFGLGLSLYLYMQEKAALRRAIVAEKEQAALREEAEKGWALEKHMREIGALSDKFTKAGMLLSQGLFEEAEQLMSTVPPIVPQSCSIYNAIGEIHARRGEWRAALTNFSLSVKVNPTNYFAYHYFLPLLVKTGDLEGYRVQRDRALQLFGDTSDPETADRIAKVCLMLPAVSAELPRLDAMADTAVKAGPDDKKWPYYQFVKGLAEYRQGHFPSAIEYVQKILPQEGNPVGNARIMPATVVAAYMVLAMAQHNAGHREEARASLAEGAAIADARMANAADGNWNEQIIARSLMDEAKTLIPDGSPDAGVTK